MSFTPGHAADPADDERALRDSVEPPVVEVRGGIAEPLLERDPEPDHRELLTRRDAELDELVPHLRAHRDQGVRDARERPLHLAEERCPGRAEVPLEHVPVERVQDDRGPRAPGQQRRRAADRAGLRRVRVQDVRPLLADDLREPLDRAGVVAEGHLALHLGDAHDPDAETLGDEGHRILAAREAPSHERRVVPARLEARREVGDVDRRAAHVEARDDAQDADLLGARRLTLAGCAVTVAVGKLVTVTCGDSDSSGGPRDGEYALRS